MTLSPEFLARTTRLLDTAPPDTTVVVASTGPNGHLLMQTATAETATPHQPAALIRIAAALLSQACDELDSFGATDTDLELLNQAQRALNELPCDAEAESV